jgi:hypothetical protein
MVDPVLSARVEALMANLQHASESYDRRALFDLAQEMWDGVVWEIRRRADTQLDELREIRTALGDPSRCSEAGGVRVLWERYEGVYQQSQAVFRECLEVLGGLAFRDKKLDRNICRVADELIAHCAKTISGRPSLTVPAPEEALNRTLGRIVRVPFPQWTIWTLPFTAHEYGHVVVNEQEPLRQVFRKEVEARVADDAAAPSPEAAWRAQAHIGEFFADGFATYTLGPAYACAAVMTRFNPSAGHATGGAAPTCAERAGIIFGMLRRMDAAEGGLMRPYEKVVDHLEEAWRQVLARATAGSAPAASGDRLDRLVGTMWHTFSREFYPLARYPAGEGGWKVAVEWSAGWQRDIADQRPLSLPAVDADSKLRNVLNAAWLCRLGEPGASSDIAEAADRLCEAILGQQHLAGARRGRRPPRSTGTQYASTRK